MIDDNTPIGDTFEETKDRKYVVEFFLWCLDPIENHDKVWGWVTLGEGSDRKLYKFWMRRGRRMSFQRQEAQWGDRTLMAETKEKMQPRKTGTYKEVPLADIETVYPGFHDEFEKQLTLAKLFDKVRGEGDRE